MVIKAVLLDAMGTLLELEPPPPVLRSLLAGRFGITIALQDAEEAFAHEIEFYRSNMGEARDLAEVANLRARCAAVLRTALPQSDALRAIDSATMTQTLLDALRFKPYADVYPLLTAARRQGIRVVVVSNWDASLSRLLADLWLAELLDGVVTSAEVGATKPDPEIFREALRVAEVEPGEAIHVGDSIDEDVAGATAAGIEPVLLRRRPVYTQRHVGVPIVDVTTIKSLTELARVL
jgi:putative hydrolase of the HAD superfamily